MRDRILGLVRWVGAVGLAATLAAPAGAMDFAVHPAADTKVVFTSKAAIETFEGKTNRMEGRLTLDPGAIGDSITVHFEVDMASLDTGMKKRNEHMRKEHLETAQHPKAVFDGAAVLSPKGAKLEPGQARSFQVEGTFLLHGVSRRLRCNATATYMPNSKPAHLMFMATFPVTLADYAIKRPEFLFLKLAETQQVRVSANASSVP